MDPLFQKISVPGDIRATDWSWAAIIYHCKYSHIILTDSLYLSVSLSVVSQLVDYKLSEARTLFSIDHLAH